MVSVEEFGTVSMPILFTTCPQLIPRQDFSGSRESSSCGFALYISKQPNYDQVISFSSPNEPPHTYSGGNSKGRVKDFRVDCTPRSA